MLAQEQSTLLEENKLLKQELSELRAQLAWFKRNVFGTGKTEKLDKSQLPLGLDETDQLPENPVTQTVSYERNQSRKKPLSKEDSYDHIAIGKTITVEPEQVKANPQAWEKVSQSSSFELAIKPPKLYRIETIYPKYRLKEDKEQSPVQAVARPRPVQGIASVSLLSYVVLSKYLDHLPLYRQEKILKRYGAVISRQNMSNWVNQVAEWLKPIYNHIREDLLAGDYLQIDESPVKVLDPDSTQKKIRQGWLWPISRPGSDVLFSWSLTRGSSHLDTLLDGFKGYLQSDGYSAYSKYSAQQEGVLPVGCMAHVRRGFKEATHNQEGKAAFAILERIAELYAIEKQLRESQACRDVVYSSRQQKSVPLLEKLHEELLRTRQEVLPQSRTGKACNYALNQWESVKRYTENGSLEIDNNLIENAIRPSVIGKKNWLFIGHPKAGEKSAILYTIIVSCERHGINPAEYLNDVLSKVPSLVNKDQRHLMPKNWKAAS